jgi:hypothetical protein
LFVLVLLRCFAAQVLQHAYFTTPRRHSQTQWAAPAAAVPEHEAGSSDPQLQQQRRGGGGGIDGKGSAQAAAGQQPDPVKDLLQQQEGVLRECSKVPLGQQGWC